ncbi:ABC transporter permease [Lactobacillus sp. ESL0236]|uniref:ABC transporter permease n=1 Tax=unclassified Lactobacillus TaxID=2620435 RepID=UPI000EFC1937|nr:MULTISPECIES: FtsX-like permease family protein [unclassified Lactobacillus]RMC38456.1 ABC transporter permease [Lactobacillus sp. ESL0237]RMC42802.1 ABC transporter permease [Lactobacillus sp. ESL0234]RMC43656.1 ABC transporter permease [Lactobacillus sp. ESL0236]
MKYRDILNSAASNLWHNKGRTFLTIIAVLIGALTLSITMGINSGVNNYLTKQIGNVGNTEQMIIAPSFSSGNSNGAPERYNTNKSSNNADGMLTKNDLKKIKTVKGIKDIKALKDSNVTYVQGLNKVKYVIDAQPTLGIAYDLKAGRQVAISGNSSEILLTKQMMKAFGYHNAQQALGKSITLVTNSPVTKKKQKISAKIVGIRNDSMISSGQNVYSHGLSQKIIKANQDGMPKALKDRYVEIVATPTSKNPDKIATIEKKLAKKGYTAQTLKDAVKQLFQTFNIATGVLIIFGAIALIAASFGVINTLYMSVRDRTREIGLMKALGLSQGKVFSIFSCEAILIGLFGSLLGLLGAMGIGQALNSVARKTFLKGIDGFTLIQFNWPNSLLIIGIICLITFLAGTLPARRAAKLDPITALRYE